MRAKPPADLLVARVAARQHGVVTLAQLFAAGLTRAAIKWRVRSGRVFRIHRGVYAVGHPGLTRRGMWKAATLALGVHAVLSHRSAAELWRLLEPSDGDPQVSVPYPGCPMERDGIRIYRSRTLAATRTTRRDGIPVTMPARTLIDLAKVATPAEVRRATRKAEQLGLPLGPDHPSEKTESDLERDFFAICRKYGIPLPQTQAWIGRHRVDFLWPEERLAIEVDGYVYHRGRQAMHDDNKRDIEIELLGIRVARIDDLRISADPAGVAADVLGLIRVARASADPIAAATARA